LDPLFILFNRDGDYPTGVRTFCHLLARRSGSYILVEPENDSESLHISRIQVPKTIFANGRRLAKYLGSRIIARSLNRAIVFVPNVGEECYLASILLVEKLNRTLDFQATILGICHSFDLNQFSILNQFQRYIPAIGCVSQKIRSALQVKLPKTKLFEIKCPVDPDFLSVSRTYELKKKIRLVYVGRLEMKQKRVDRLIKVIQMLEQRNISFEFLIVGDGPARKQLESGLGELDLSQNDNRVVFSGAVPNNRVREFLQSSDIQLMVSDFEGNPIAILEGMATGICPVVMDMENGWDSIEHRRNGFIVPTDNVHEMVEIIAMLSMNPNELTRIGQNAAESAKQFSVESVDAVLLEEVRYSLSASVEFAVPPQTKTEVRISNCVSKLASKFGEPTLGIWGAGHLGRALISELLDHGLTVHVLVDASREKIGSKIGPFEIKDPAALNEYVIDCLILASIDFSTEILQEVDAIYSDNMNLRPEIVLL
jgi:glycosyltransferase involved in cell wall biosynthesis